jgi:hypothetical protein
MRPRGGGGSSRDGGLRLSRLLLLRSRSWSRGEKEGERRRRRRGGDEEELLREGDLRRGGGLRERARMGLRERERYGGPPERDERSLEGVLPRGGDAREWGGERYRGR